MEQSGLMNEWSRTRRKKVCTRDGIARRFKDVQVLSVQRIRHVLHFRVPTRATVTAVCRSLGCSRTGVALDGSWCRMDGAGRVSEVGWWWRVDQVSGNAEGQVRGELCLSKVLANDAVLASREPVPNLGSANGNLSDVPQHLDTLEVAAIELAEVGHTGFSGLPVDQLDHGSDPFGTTEAVEATLICSVYLGSAEVAFEGVAAGADATADSSELGTDQAGDGRNAPGVAGHLAWVGEAAHDLPGLGTRHADKDGEERLAL